MDTGHPHEVCQGPGSVMARHQRLLALVTAVAALPVLVLATPRLAQPEIGNPDRSLVEIDGLPGDWDGRQDGVCTFAICGRPPLIRVCERGESPAAEFRVRLTSRGRCERKRVVTVEGMRVRADCFPGPLPVTTSTTSTTLPGPCGTVTDFEVDPARVTCIDGWRKLCPTEPACDLDHRQDGACVFGFFCRGGPVVTCYFPGAKDCLPGRGYVRLPPFRRVVVLVGKSRTVRWGRSEYTLRCMRHP